MSEQFGYEIDMLPVGNGDKSGDAIAVRYGNSSTGYKVMVVDGGTRESGAKLVEHIKEFYGTTRVDYMVCTHPDNDHSSGLRVVMEEMEVGELWMHRPWNHSHHVHDYVADGRVTHKSLTANIQKSLSTAHELEGMAEDRGISVHEPLQGSHIGIFEVLSPTLDFYKELLVEEYGDSEESLGRSLLDMLKNAMDAGAEALARMVGETWGIETLREDGKTSPLNETSVVLFASIEGRGVLLTGDAGIRALTHAMDFAQATMLPLHELRFVQIPHHGSRRNVSPSLLNRLIGKPLAEGATRSSSLSACVSASKDSKTHPRKVVTNAFRRRGAAVTGTQGSTTRHHHNMPARAGWGPAPQIPFHDVVESYEEVTEDA
ncbi:MAG: MBL fold metallo-hydrolase [Alphaproteobacteria bacterium]